MIITISFVYFNILYILTTKGFNYIYKNKQNVYWQVGLYTFIAITLRWWHLGVGTCRSLCMSCVLY